MKTRKRWLSLVLFFALLAIGAGGALASEGSIDERTRMAADYYLGKLPYVGPPVTYTGPPITIRYATFMSPAMKTWYDGIYLPGVEALERESNGKLLVKAYFSGVLHGARGGFEACSQGVSDYDHCYSAWKGQSFHLIHGVTLPFAFPDSVVGSMVTEELYPKYFKKEYEAEGVYLQKVTVLGNHQFFTKNRPIGKLEDVKGMKVAAAGGITAQIIKSLGAVPVVSPPTEFYTGFQRGVFDAVLTMDAGAVNFRVHELAKYRTEVNLTTQVIETCFNKKFFDGLPKDLQRILYNWSRKESQTSAQIYYERGGASALEIFRKAGIESTKLSSQEIERWKATTRPVVDKFIADNEALGLPARQMVKDMEGLTKKYSAMTWNDLMKRAIEHPIQGIIDF